MLEDVKIFAIGDSALTVQFSDEICRAANERALALAEHFTLNTFEGFIEAAPAYSSTSLFYDPVVVRRTYPQFLTACEAVQALVRAALPTLRGSRTAPRVSIEIPVRFGGEDGPDLTIVAERAGLSPREVMDIFVAPGYRVYMLGFLPGFTYMGDVDLRIAAPRRDSPRTRVPRGSVGIAGRQTGVYSLESPGGWQLIGRADIAMFSPNSEFPTLCRPGDIVRFVEQ
jgi:inhibitor of KinA